MTLAYRKKIFFKIVFILAVFTRQKVNKLTVRTFSLFAGFFLQYVARKNLQKKRESSHCAKAVGPSRTYFLQD